MPASPARSAAFDILLRVDTHQAYAGELLHSERLLTLSPADRSLCMELVMGVLRWRLLLDRHIADFSFTPFRKLDAQVLTALRLGAYQIEFLERIPARAAINESVELVKQARKVSAAPLVNAVLRKIPKTTSEVRMRRRRGELAAGVSENSEATAASLAGSLAHPQWLVERWMASYGSEMTAAICGYDQQAPATALRLRPLSNPGRQASAGEIEEELRKAGVEVVPAELMSTARRVVSGDATHTTAYAQGRVAVQDEASQLVGALVGHGARILDCCASPGGKTAVLADGNPRADIVALDLHEHRARLLRQRVESRNVRVVAADARVIPVAGAFDRILVDAPCSGTGSLARNPEIKYRLTAEDLRELRERQLAILQAAARSLARGGRLIYSTCSLEPEENESLVAEALAGAGLSALRVVDCRQELERLRETGELVWPEIAGLLRGPFLRTIPGVHPCEGFFAAVLERA
jgi:16S rRNA (cytosine967-C5)-methyltransferase